MSLHWSLYLVVAVALAMLAYCGRLYQFIRRQSAGDARMETIASAIRTGAMAFLRREYTILAIYSIVVSIGLALLSKGQALAFLAGAVLAALTGWIGMRVATKSNVRTAQAATESLSRALKVSFASGTIMGLCAVSVALLGLVGVLLASGTNATGNPNTDYLFGFGLGCASIALFMRVGGGIYTKAADVGADLVGKVEYDFPEDDPRNPAVVADNVGDNVGDVAGMGADLYDSYVVTMVAALLIGVAHFPNDSLAQLFPLLAGAAGLLCCWLASFFVRAAEPDEVQGALRVGLWIATALTVLTSFGLCFACFPRETALKIFYATCAGVVTGGLVGLCTEYFTSAQFRPTKFIAKQAETGAASNIMAGLTVGLISPAIPVLIIGVAVLVSHHFAGVYGVAIAGVGMLSTLGMALAVDAYGPVADNAGGIAQMAKLPAQVRERTDALDSAGNTTAAIGKGFAIGSAGLTVLALLVAYAEEAGLVPKEGAAPAVKGASAVVSTGVNILDPIVLVGLFIGGILPFAFCALCMNGVAVAAFDMIKEVRRQFAEIPGLLHGKAEPDHARCVDIATLGALRAMIVPSLLVLLAPIAVYFLLGKAALAAMLTGALVAGMLLGITMANSGGAWDNAKKLIEQRPGGKGSAEHKASIVGDTVGDPFKDTAGPSINILIKMMSIIAMLLLMLVK